MTPTASTRLWSKVLTFFQVILLGPITLVSTVTSVMLCPCCLSAMLEADDLGDRTVLSKVYQLFSTCMTGWGLVYMAVLVVLPLVALFGSVAFVLFVVFYILLGVIR